MDTTAENTKTFWDKFQKENAEWATVNYPKSIGHPEHPLLGIVEELGELAEAIEQKDRDKATDACADVAIYALDLCTKMGWSAGDIIGAAVVTDQADVDEEDEGPVFTRLMALSGKLAHHWLKLAQGIRKNEDHPEGIRKALVGILALVWDVHTDVREDTAKTFVEDVWATWQRVVQKRDWVKFPHDGRTH